MGGHSLGAPSLFRDGHSVALRQKTSEIGKERSPLRLKFANDFRHLGRKGHQFPSQRFGQRPEQFLDLGFAQPGHRPLQDSSPSPLGQGCGQLHSDTVVSLAGRIRVHQRHHLAIDRHAVRERVLIEMQVFAAGDLRLGGTQKPGLGVVAHQPVQFVQRRDVFQVPGVEFEEDLIEVHGVAPQAGLPVLHLFAERPVGRHETRFGRGRGRLHGPDHGPVVVTVEVVVPAGESRGQQVVFNQR